VVQTVPKDNNSKTVQASLGVVADTAAVTGVLIAGGWLLVWILAGVHLMFGFLVIVREWGQPFSRTTALGVAAAVLGGGLLGFAIGATTRNTPETAAQTSTEHSTVTESPDDASPPETTTTDLTTTDPTTTAPSSTSTTSVQVPNRIAHSDSEELFVGYGEYDIDDAGGYDLDIADRSINAVNRAQFAVKLPADPTPAECVAIPADQWRASVPLEEFRDGAVYCLRTDSGQLGFLVVEQVELDGPTIFLVHSHWTIWE
jgi:hypothetical protein